MADTNQHLLRRVARSTGTLSAGILGSRFLGLFRDMARAYLLGTGVAADAWVIAYRLPNLLRAFFAEGSLSAAFVPVLSQAIETRPREDVWRLVNAVLSVLLIVLMLVTAGFLFLAPQLVPFLAPGFSDVPGKLPLTIWLARATFPYLILIGVATVLMGTLNALHHFRAPALAPATLNVFILAALLGLCPLLGSDPTTQVRGLAAGVLVGGLAQVFIQLPPLYRRGFRLRFHPDFRNPGVGEITRLMLPGLVGIGISEINAVVDSILGSLLESGSVASLEYGMRLMHLPLGVIGVALGTATLPTLSRQALRQDLDGVRDTYGFALRMILFIMTPALLTLVLLARPMVALIFERGAFTASESTSMTAQAVAFYGSGLLFYGAAKVTVPVFFSFKDTTTPVKCAAVALVSNIVLNLILMGPLRLAGLALATAISAGLNVTLLLLALHRRLGHFNARVILKSASRAALGGAVMTALVLLVLGALPAGGTVLAKTLRVFLPLGAGLAAYVGVAAATGSEEWRFLRVGVFQRGGGSS